MGRGIIGLFVGLWVLVACEAPSTPVPVGVATSVPQTVEVQVQSTPIPETTLSIGIANDTVAFIDNLDELQQIASIGSFADETQAADFDLAFGYGVFEGWQQATPQEIIVVFNTNLAPLNQPEIMQLIQQSIDAFQISETLSIAGVEVLATGALTPSEVRTQLANRSFPDGLQLSAVYEKTPILEPFGESLRQRNIRLNLSPLNTDLDTVLGQNLAHIVLLSSNSDKSPDTLPLLRLPISYRTNGDIPITFSASGFPQPQE